MPIFYPNDIANIIADYLENEFTPNNLWDHDHKRQVEARVYALLPTVDEDTPVKFRRCDVSKEIQYLKLGKAVVLEAFQMNFFLQRRSVVHLTHLFNYYIWLCRFPARWKQKSYPCRNPARMQTFPKIYV
jgi:hypothetical protein